MLPLELLRELADQNLEFALVRVACALHSERFRWSCHIGPQIGGAGHGSGHSASEAISEAIKARKAALAASH